MNGDCIGMVAGCEISHPGCECWAGCEGRDGSDGNDAPPGYEDWLPDGTDGADGGAGMACMARVPNSAMSAPGVDVLGRDDPGMTAGGAPVGLSAKSSGGCCCGGCCWPFAFDAAKAAIHSGA